MSSASVLCRNYPRRAGGRAYDAEAQEEEADGREASDLASGAAGLIRQLKAGSLHFRGLSFRSAFVINCLESGALRAMLGEETMDAPRYARRHSSGLACGGGTRDPEVLFQGFPALESAATAAAHGCQMPGMIFEAHRLEGLDGRQVSQEEAELLERTNYGLVYLPPAARPQFARVLGAGGNHNSNNSNNNNNSQDAARGLPTTAPADNYPSAGERDGFILEDLWVCQSHRKIAEAAAWLLPMAYGLVPANPGGSRPLPAAVSSSGRASTAPTQRLQYKRQVAAAVRATALSHCDALLVGCAGGLPGADNALTIEEAAGVWAEVLLGTGISEEGVGPQGQSPLHLHFKLIVFCFGGGLSQHRRAQTKLELEAAFRRR